VRNIPPDDPLQRLSDTLRAFQVADAREEAAYRAGTLVYPTVETATAAVGARL
jgi:hypothetical protein